MSDQQCDFPRCRKLKYMGYIGSKICCDHWEELCGADCKTEKRLLKKIGLVRDKNGSVAVINKKENENEQQDKL